MRHPRPFVTVSDEPKPGPSLLALVVETLVGLLLWVGILAGVRWYMALSDVVQLRFLSGALLVLGSWAVFEGLARADLRDRRSETPRMSRRWMRQRRDA